MTNTLVTIALNLMLVAPLNAATYYVSTAGNNSNSGTLDSPWRTVAHGVSQLFAGDTLYVRGGTYAETGTIHFSRTGTQTNQIRLLNFPNERPIISWTTQATTSRIFLRHASGITTAIGWITIDGFEIRNGYEGIKGHNVHDSTFQRNWIHNNLNQGVLVNGSARILFTRNVVNHNGDFAGCSSCTKQHGLYANGTAWTITNNLFYDNLGYGIQQNGASSSMDPAVHAGTEYMGARNWIVRNNTFAYNRFRAGMILWGSQVHNTHIDNNIFYENAVTQSTSAAQGIEFLSTGSANGILIRNSHAFASGSGGQAFIVGGTGGGVNYTASGNIVNVSAPGFITGGSNSLPSTPDWRIVSASAPVVGAGLNGVTIGAFQPFVPVSASISTNTINLTFNPAFAPLIPGGTVGWSVGCSGAGCGTPSVTGVSQIAQTIVGLTVSGFSGGTCNLGDAITSSFNTSTGSLFDGAMIGGTWSQPAHTITAFPVANQCTGEPPPAGPGVEFIKYDLDGNALDSSGDNHHGTQDGGTYVDGRYGQALQGTAGTAVRVAAPYGNGIDPSSQDLTVAFSYTVPVGAANATQTVYGSSIGSDQRNAISAVGSTWQIAVQNSPVSSATPSTKAVQVGVPTRLCLQYNSSARIAALYVDGEEGPSKPFTPFVFASDVAVGLPPGFSPTVAGGGKWEHFRLWTDLVSCQEDWLAWNPPPPPSGGLLAQTAWRAQRIRINAAQSLEFYGPLNERVKIQRGGAGAVSIDVDCAAAANCESVALYPWYSLNGGDAQALPNTFTSDGVAFYGPTTDPTIYSGNPGPLDGIGDIPGHTQIVSTDAPILTLGDGEHHVVRIPIRISSDRQPGDVICIKLRNQNGNELSGYTPSEGACVEVMELEAGLY